MRGIEVRIHGDIDKVTRELWKNNKKTENGRTNVGNDEEGDFIFNFNNLRVAYYNSKNKQIENMTLCIHKAQGNNVAFVHHIQTGTNNLTLYCW